MNGGHAKQATPCVHYVEGQLNAMQTAKCTNEINICLPAKRSLFLSNHNNYTALPCWGGYLNVPWYSFSFNYRFPLHPVSREWKEKQNTYNLKFFVTLLSSYRHTVCNAVQMIGSLRCFSLPLSELCSTSCTVECKRHISSTILIITQFVIK